MLIEIKKLYQNSYGITHVPQTITLIHKRLTNNDQLMDLKSASSIMAHEDQGLILMDLEIRSTHDDHHGDKSIYLGFTYYLIHLHVS